MRKTVTCKKCHTKREIIRRKNTKPDAKFYCANCKKMVTPNLT